MVKRLDNDDFNILKKESPEKWQYLNKKLAYPDEYFNSIDDYKQPFYNLKKEDFFNKLKNKCPDDEEKQKTKEIIEIFANKSGEKLTKLYLKGDVILLAEVFEKFFEISTEEY